MESGKFTSIHQLIDASLDSVLGEGVADLRLRRKICRGMLDELRKSHSQGDASAGPLPRSPHMLCSEKMEGLLHGEVMSVHMWICSGSFLPRHAVSDTLE